MSLTAGSLSVQMGWTLQNAPVGNYQPLVQGPDALLFALTGLDLSVWTKLYAAQLTIAGGANTDIDLSSFTDLLNTSSGFSQIMSLLIAPTGVLATAQCTLSPSASNGLVWFFGGTTPSVTIPMNGLFALSLPGTAASGQTVDGSHKKLNLANGGSTATVVTVLAFGK